MTTKQMEVKLTIFPAEVEMLPIYERLVAFNERESSNIIKSLLLIALEAKKIPAWFQDLESVPFTSYRGRTIRIRLDPAEPQYAFWVRRLQPLNNNEQILLIKQILRSALLSNFDTQSITTTEIVTPEAAPPPIEAPVSTANNPPAPVDQVAPPDKSSPGKKKNIKNLSGLYR